MKENTIMVSAESARRALLVKLELQWTEIHFHELGEFRRNCVITACLGNAYFLILESLLFGILFRT